MSTQDKDISINVKTLFPSVIVLLVAIVISGGIYFGLKGSRASNSNVEESNEKEQVLGKGASEGQNQSTTTSIDDDPILGNKDTAKVAIVEFSDYECLFCNKFRTDTLGQIKKEYIDTGKVILVYRDLPLPFHNPAAEQEAIAGECIQEQGGDKAYFQYHDKIFETSPGNGEGVGLDGLANISVELGLDGNKLTECINNGQFKDEVKEDMAEADRIGINGTPGFVIGKLDDKGNVKGEIISGAQPFSSFQKAIDKQLN